MNTPFAQSFGLRFRGRGYSFKAAPNTETVLDIPIDMSCLINGGEFFSLGAGGDYIIAEVIDKDNLTGLVQNGIPVVLDRFIDKWYLNTQDISKIPVSYPARLCPGLYIRIKYMNFHAEEEDVFVNLYLHKTKEIFTIQDLLAG